jgi:uncharacterized protein YdaT
VDRLRTKEEREASEKEKMRIVKSAIEREKVGAVQRRKAMMARGAGTVVLKLRGFGGMECVHFCW